MTDAPSSATWAASFIAEELLGFEAVLMDDVPDDPPKALSPAARLARARRRAADRSQRARDKARRVAELDRAIAEGLAVTMRKRRLPDKVAAARGFKTYGVLLEHLFAEARTVLVQDFGWPREAAIRALTGRLLRPTQPAATQA